jgi:D-glycerate 3-kinase
MVTCQNNPGSRVYVRMGLVKPPTIAAMAKVSIIVEHVLAHLSNPCPSQSSTSSPLFLALQGPQGSGKTFLTEHVKNKLSCADERHSALRVATLSIDDLYLPHTQLKAVTSSNPGNALLRGRGQPGTHDIRLGLSILRSLKDINRSPTNDLHIPRFDKSLFGGEGDRLPESQWTPIHGPLDVVLLEGWCVGFYPQSRQYIERHMNEAPLGLEQTFDVSSYTLEHVLELNQHLAEYAKWWDLFDIFVQVRKHSSPRPLTTQLHRVEWEQTDRSSGRESIHAHI